MFEQYQISWATSYLLLYLHFELGGPTYMGMERMKSSYLLGTNNAPGSPCPRPGPAAAPRRLAGRGPVPHMVPQRNIEILAEKKRLTDLAGK